MYSRGLTFILASLVLLFFLAITVESRTVSFTAPLLPESTSKVDKTNKKQVGSAIGYLALRGKTAFGLSVLAVANIDPTTISRVSLFYTKKTSSVIANLTLTGGYYTYDARIDYATGVDIHEHKISVGYWITKGTSKERLVVAGPLKNDRLSFISYLQSDQEVTTPTGTKKNDGFSIVHLSVVDSSTYKISASVNYDIDESVTAIEIYGPAPSGAEATKALVSFNINKFDKAGKIYQTNVNSTVFAWMANHLTYVNVITKKNTKGALRGQIIALTNTRYKIPVFPNGVTKTVKGVDITFLPDGGSIIGDLPLAFNSGGARPSNATLGFLDERVAYFIKNNASTFSNTFRFPLPVTLVNRFNTRGAQFYSRVAAEVVDNALWRVSLYNLAKNAADTTNFFNVPGAGNRTYAFRSFDLYPGQFDKYLGPGGIFLQVSTNSAVTNPLYVDLFLTQYHIASAFSNTIVRDIFFKGSDASK